MYLVFEYSYYQKCRRSNFCLLKTLSRNCCTKALFQKAQLQKRYSAPNAMILLFYNCLRSRPTRSIRGSLPARPGPPARYRSRPCRRLPTCVLRRARSSGIGARRRRWCVRRLCRRPAGARPGAGAGGPLGSWRLREGALRQCCWTGMSGVGKPALIAGSGPQEHPWEKQA